MNIPKDLIERISRYFENSESSPEKKGGSLHGIDDGFLRIPDPRDAPLNRGSDERYRFLAENISDVIWVLGLDLKFQYISPSCKALLGYAAEEAMKMKIEDIITPPSFDVAMNLLLDELKREAEGGADPFRTIYQDLEFNRRDGSTVWGESRIMFVREEGRPVGLLGVTRDNTARRDAMENLRRSEERYRSILESIEDGYYEVDLSGRYVLLNSGFCRMMGYAPEELMGMSYKNLVPEDARQMFYAKYHEVYVTGTPVRLFSSRFVRKDNTIGYGEGSVSLRFSPQGEKIGFCGIVRDRSEIKKMEEALKQSEQKWRSLYSSMPGGSYVIDSDRTISDANPITCTVTGYRYEELVGQRCSILCGEDEDGCSCLLFDRRTDKIDNRETVIKTKDGRRVPIIQSAQRIKVSEGEIVLNNFHDITKMKEIEEALRKSEEALRERNEVMEKDLRAAQLIQKSLLSVNIPKLGWLRSDYRYLPLDAVGGDYFSLTHLREGGLGVFIGDVSSHGVTAALFLSLVKATTDRICREYALKPVRFVSTLNRELYGNMPLSFLTAVYGVFGSREGGGADFTFSSAGHPHPILFRAGSGKADFVNCKGTLIGMFDDLEFREKQIILGKGDRLFLYTDGIPETMNENNEIFGFDSLTGLVMRAHDSSLSATLDNIMDEINRFKGNAALSDDIILLGFEVA
jgi:PAS domain S-box-containing protein